MNRAPLLFIKGLKHHWGEGFTLSIDQWEVAQGTRVALIGPSGAGKSTLLMLLAGVLSPQEGEIWVLGTALHAMNESERRAWRASHIGLLAQSFAHIEHLSALENCKLPVQFRLRDTEFSHTEELKDLLKILKIEHLSHKRPNTLSQGEQQRFALARALLASPPLILADEPTAHLDPHATEQSLSLLQHPRSQGGLIVVTHDHSQLEGFDMVWRLTEGHLERVHGLEHLDQHSFTEQPEKLFFELHSSSTTRHSSTSAWTALMSFGLKATRYYWGRALTIALALALTLSIPFSLNQVGERLERRLLERAHHSPLVLGTPGSRFDLTLRSLYFKGAKLKPLTWQDLKSVYRIGGVEATPLHLRYRARGMPLVGTSLEYYELRQIQIQHGHLPQRLGEVVLSQRLAQKLKVQTGDFLSSDQKDLYNLASTYPIELEVVGIFFNQNSPDDEAIFTEIKTCWVIEGKGHGHQERQGQQGAELVMAQKLTGTNAQTIHFHGDMNTYPISSLLIFPKDERSHSLFKARAQHQTHWHITTPKTVIHELLKIIFKIKDLLNALSKGALVLTCVLALLISWLSFTIRAHEWRALALLGLKPIQILYAGVSELLGILVLSALLLFSSLLLIPYFETLVWSSLQ